jgi:hypothetical protein
MALRPVSDLGLVDLTDLAEASPRSAPKRRQPAKAQKAATPARKPPTAPARSKAGGRANSTAAAPVQSKGTGPIHTKVSRPARTRAASVARAGMVVATWTAAGACGLMLGRAAVRR